MPPHCVRVATASMLANIEARATARKSLPCFHLDPMANAKGNDLDALAAGLDRYLTSPRWYQEQPAETMPTGTPVRSSTNST